MSTKSGGPVAGAWAVLNFLGEAGYSKIVEDVTETTRRMIEGINNIGTIHVLGKPDMCMFAIASNEINVYQLADEMKTRGWYLQPQFSIDGLPPNLHITANQNSTAVVDSFLKDLCEAVVAVKNDPEQIDAKAVREQIEALLAQPGDASLADLAAMVGIDGTKLPEKMALLNTILDCIPDNLTEELLINFINDLYV